MMMIMVMTDYDSDDDDEDTGNDIGDSDDHIDVIYYNSDDFSFFFWYSAVNSRSMTPITWQVAVNDEEQRPLLQDILEAAVDDRRQAAVDVEEQRPQLQDIFEAIDGNHV